MSLPNITHGPQRRPPRIIILGEPKLGKSTWASQSAAPIFIPVKGEEGIDALDVDKFPVANSFEEVVADLDMLSAEQHQYKTIVIDSASALEPLVWKSTVAAHADKGQKNIEDFGFAKGYIFALDEWRKVMERLDVLRARGMTSIIIGHARSKTVMTPDTEPYDSWVWDIHDKAASLFYRWADFIGFAGRVVSVTHGDRKDSATDLGRWLFTQRSATHPCGGRGAYGHLPERIELSFPAFRAAYVAAEKADAERKRALEEAIAAHNAAHSQSSPDKE